MFTPKLTITPEINNRIAKIERLRAIVERTKILPEIEIQLRFRANVESVHSSTSIEGNPLNELQVQDVLKGKTIQAPGYAITEVINYKKALDWLERLQKKNQQITAEDILTVHRFVMNNLLPKEKVGNWRKGAVYVVDEKNNQEIIQYEGPDAGDVPLLVKSLLQWIYLQVDQPLHPILLAGLIHYIFVSIHPFSDGNGRTTRLLTLFFLRCFGYGFAKTISLDSYYLQHQMEYYGALSQSKTFTGRMDADTTPFLDFFTKGFLSVVQSLQQYVELGQITNKKKRTVRLTQEELVIIDYAHQFDSITIQDVVDALRIPQRTAQRRLQELVEKKILIKKDAGPATKYLINK